MKPSPLHVLTFATGSYLRWLVLLHANLRLLALPATELSVCTGDETSRRATRAMGLEVLDFSRSGHPGHYYNDSTHGIVAHLANLLQREPQRNASSSVNSGLHGHGSSMTASDTIRDQYTRGRSDHPFEMERGIIRAWSESKCFSSAVP